MSTKNCFIKSTIIIIGLLCCFSIGQASMNGGVSVTVAKPSITLNHLSFTKSGAETFTLTISNVPADYAAKGYRVEWGNKGITTGLTKSRDPYQVTGVLSEGFRASSGDLHVRLMKDNVVVTETSLLSSATPIIVSDKTICSGDADRTITAQVPSWEPGYWIRWTDDAWHVDPGLEITDNTTVRISDNYPVGEHMLWAFLFTGTGNLVGSASFKLTILPGPLAEIEDMAGCVSPGAGFTLSARASENCTYLWDYGSVSRNSEVGLTIDGVMGDEDMQYILKVTDKSNGCVSSDTAIVRSAPAVPQVAIDTNTSRLDIKIHWSAVNGATGYNVYSRRWDPYCLTSENGGTYAKTTVASPVYTRSAANVANDTLAFFYVTATNGTCESSPSDTVGYYNRKLRLNPLGSGNSSKDWITLYFDMKDKGFTTSGDLFKKVPGVFASIAKWDYLEQTEGSATTPFDPGNGGLLEYDNIFPIKQGDVVCVEMIRENSFLQYGKLPEPIAISILGSNTDNTNHTWGFIQPSNCNITDTKMLLELFRGKIISIASWSFTTQGLGVSTTIFDPGDGSPVEYDAVFPVRPLMPLQLENGFGKEVIWK